MNISEQQAESYVRLALDGLEREFPNKPGMVLDHLDDLKRPRELYPVFYGHFDWHSSVHAHWTAVCLLRHFPNAKWADDVRAALSRKFSAEKLAAEASYLRSNPSFERMYGWAWALRLGIELRGLGNRDWTEWYRPVEDAIVANAQSYLPKLDWPVRCGFHPESSFPLSQMLDWSRATGNSDFEALLTQRAIHYYGADTNYPVAYEPSGNDFFSTGLNETNLMRRVLPQQEFEQWLEAFLPEFKQGRAGNLLAPVSVSDLDDGHIVHLVGLNLSRAWSMRGIASALRADNPARCILLKSADHHQQAGLKQVHSGSYEGEHWLGTFAVYLLTMKDIEKPY